MKKKQKKTRYNRKSLEQLIVGVFSNAPEKTFNYKQIARRLEIKDMGEKQLIVGILRDLTESNVGGRYFYIAAKFE